MEADGTATAEELLGHLEAALGPFDQSGSMLETQLAAEDGARFSVLAFGAGGRSLFATFGVSRHRLEHERGTVAQELVVAVEDRDFAVNVLSAIGRHVLERHRAAAPGERHRLPGWNDASAIEGVMAVPDPAVGSFSAAEPPIEFVRLLPSPRAKRRTWENGDGGTSTRGSPRRVSTRRICSALRSSDFRHGAARKASAPVRRVEDVAKPAVQFACTECGYSSGRWFGKCPGCSSFGTLVEEVIGRVSAGKAPPKPLLRLVDVQVEEAQRFPTGIPELDRVLGGGLVPASLVLVGGEPGVGKSTLLLTALQAMSADRRTLLITGEESVAQVKLRAERLGGAANVEILAETELETVCETLIAERPDVCVIDSVQTLYSAELGSAPGSVAQVREAAGRLLRVAKENNVATILVGHVTKDGTVAGPRVLEHLVDCVLQFEGDRYRAHRVLRAVKNRFGSTNEIGVFEMTGAGLVGVPDPSEVFGRTVHGEAGAAVACALEGTRPILLEIQALVSQTDLAMPRRVATGVDPKRLAMIVAVLARHAGLPLGQADVFVNVAGGLRIDEPGADLAVALAIASAARRTPVRAGIAVFGEIGLTGRLREATQADRRLEECSKLGLEAVVCPTGTPARGTLTVVQAETLRQAIKAGLDAERAEGADEA